MNFGLPRNCSCWLLALVCSACGAEPDPWLEDIERALPARLSQVGLFERLDTLEPAPSLQPYDPVWPLYSSGSGKVRFLSLPDGSAIDAEAPSWNFPVGTVLAKTFTYDDIVGHEGVKPVETRLLFRRVDGWDYALYQWDETATDATLLPDEWGEIALELDRAEDPAFPYILPARLDCRTCHETHEEITGTPVLGVSAHQADEELARSNMFTRPAATKTVEGRTDSETEAFGYFIGNCISCHNGGRSSNATFSLYPEDVLEETIDKPTEGETIGGVRIVPGNADESALFIAVVQAHEPGFTGQVKPMPPLGVTQVDPDVERILRTWIEAL